MNIINLYEHIRYWHFLLDLQKNNPFDLIVFEEIPEWFIENHKKLKLNIMRLDNLWYEFWISWTIAWLSKQYKNILFILDKLNYIYIIPTIKRLWDSNITVINLWSGISWTLNKWIPELEDIWVLSNFNINIFEPYDLLSLIRTLQLKWNKYIRISYKELPINLFEWADNYDNYNKQIVSLTEFGLTGDSGTIIFWWYMINEIIHTINLAQQKWIFYDWFMINSYDFKISDELRDSLQKTEKLIIILDQINSNYPSLIKAKLFDNWLFDTEIITIYPSISGINTNLEEYIFSQAKFDWVWILEKIS